MRLRARHRVRPAPKSHPIRETAKVQSQRSRAFARSRDDALMCQLRSRSGTRPEAGRDATPWWRWRNLLAAHHQKQTKENPARLKASRRSGPGEARSRISNQSTRQALGHPARASAPNKPTRSPPPPLHALLILKQFCELFHDRAAELFDIHDRHRPPVIAGHIVANANGDELHGRDFLDPLNHAS